MQLFVAEAASSESRIPNSALDHHPPQLCVVGLQRMGLWDCKLFMMIP